METERSKAETGCSKIEIIPYLPFNGNCEEAVNTYIRAFGGEVHYVACRSESTCGVPSEHGKQVLHMEFTLGNARMAAGDHVEDPETAADIILVLRVDSEEEALRAVNLLGKGGSVLSPLHKRQEANADDCDAVLMDRFGITWIIACRKSVEE